MRMFYITEGVNEGRILRQIEKDKVHAWVHYHAVGDSCNDKCQIHNGETK